MNLPFNTPRPLRRLITLAAFLIIVFCLVAQPGCSTPQPIPAETTIEPSTTSADYRSRENRGKEFKVEVKSKPLPPPPPAPIIVRPTPTYIFINPPATPCPNCPPPPPAKPMQQVVPDFVPIPQSSPPAPPQETRP